MLLISKSLLLLFLLDLPSNSLYGNSDGIYSLDNRLVFALELRMRYIQYYSLSFGGNEILNSKTFTNAFQFLFLQKGNNLKRVYENIYIDYSCYKQIEKEAFLRE